MTVQDRRAALRTFAGLGLGAAALAVAPKRAFAQEKIAKTAVQYQDTPKDGNECDKCVNWVAPNGCTIVAGEIHPKGWCVAFAPKAG